MFEYKNSIKTLIEFFPELASEYLHDIDYYRGLPYVFYESVFVKFIIKEISNKNETTLIRIFNFIEKILKEGDKDSKNLVEVSVIEALFFKGIFAKDDIAFSLLGTLSRKSLGECNNTNGY